MCLYLCVFVCLQAYLRNHEVQTSPNFVSMLPVLDLYLAALCTSIYVDNVIFHTVNPTAACHYCSSLTALNPCWVVLVVSCYRLRQALKLEESFIQWVPAVVYAGHHCFFLAVSIVPYHVVAISSCIRVRTIHNKLDQTNSVILCHLDWPCQYLVQY